MTHDEIVAIELWLLILSGAPVSILDYLERV